MKLVSFVRKNDSREEVGILREDRVLPLVELGYAYANMNELILRSTPEELYEKMWLKQHISHRQHTI